MAESYIISIDQSTQGTKALLFDRDGMLLQRKDLPHKQIINEKGWVSHDPEEIYQNTVQVVKNLVEESGISKESVKGIGISNQRETSLIWEKKTGKALANAVVWQCARAAEICRRVEQIGAAEMIRQKTGLALSPYFPASKLTWLKENVEGAKELAKKHALCFGTIDTWLVYRMTHGMSYKTDYSNASRTQLFDIFEQKWDEEICQLFGLDAQDLAEVCDSDSCFGETDLEGFFESPVPIHSVLGDSHGALFGQGCLEKGMIKSTYGTGSSIMMNIGETPVLSTHGVVTSLAWGMQGKVSYVLEGNINYTGAVISWLKDDMELIQSPSETEGLCRVAEADDSLYFVPAFTGLGAPYWNSEAKGALTGITRTTRKAEMVRAGVECIAYQISDVVNAMSQDAKTEIQELRVDGGPTRNQYLMQFQSDILDRKVLVPDAEELSGIGAAYAAGRGLGLYGDEVFTRLKRREYAPKMCEDTRVRKYNGWKDAVGHVLK
ncbi:glycerol kinase GlpK [[Ruminococcus] gnavus]|jgi:glycerol kinase|uniref:FGGY-family carbohydrate kinase n=1 Tax=Mediterraneibacter gnavus TaxID=33038 RepID=UPI00156F9C5D|nr:glycerol kinase [Mediterraneibacter gnavus]NSD11374.1 glycerol kinase GlpK [Mediterraneibacter gnavus]